VHGDYQTVRTLLVALSANGKTTTSCRILARKGKERSWLIQDDGGTLMPDGSYYQEEENREFDWLQASAAGIYLQDDFKVIEDKFYINTCSSRLEPVLNTIKESSKHCHVELTNLIIPNLNDSEENFIKLVDWVYNNLGDSVPLHFSRYFPCYKLDFPPTPIVTLKKAETIAKKKLKFVYLGNI